MLFSAIIGADIESFVSEELRRECIHEVEALGVLNGCDQRLHNAPEKSRERHKEWFQYSLGWEKGVCFSCRFPDRSCWDSGHPRGHHHFVLCLQN